MAGFDRRQVRRAFSRAAATYDGAARLQRLVGERLAESLDYAKDPVFHPDPIRVIVDAGSGTGVGARHLQRQFADATVFEVDVAMGMLQVSQPAQSSMQRLRNLFAAVRKPVQIQADIRALPFADHSVDMIHSNLCLQWVEDLQATLNGFRRVLKPGGMLLFSTFGPATLHELRDAFAQADGTSPHVSPFANINQWGDALIATGFRNPVLDRDTEIEKHPSFKALLRSLKDIGATNSMSERRRSLTGKARLQAAEAAYMDWSDPRDGSLPATWEVIYAVAWAPPLDAPIREHGVDEVRIDAAAIPVRRRGAPDAATK